MNSNKITTSEKITSEKDIIWLDENGIIRITLKEGFEFDETDVQRQFDSYTKLGIGIQNKALLLADASVEFVMTKEARELSSQKAKEYFIAGAIISRSVATRLLINFLNSFSAKYFILILRSNILPFLS